MRWTAGTSPNLILSFKAAGPLVAIGVLFPLSTMCIFFALRSLHIAAYIPKTLEELSRIGTDLEGYAASSVAAHMHVLAVLSILALWKHAWSVPGSVLLVRRACRAAARH